jgi:hypothetical protein
MANVNSTKIVISLCILTVYIETLMINQDVANGQDKSTSITCDDPGLCEKKECVNGDCETTTTNSSDTIDMSSSLNSNDDDNTPGVDTENSVTDSIEERIDMREN